MFVMTVFIIIATHIIVGSLFKNIYPPLQHHCGAFIQKHISIITTFLLLTHSRILFSSSSFFPPFFEWQIYLHNEPNNTNIYFKRMDGT